MADSPPATGLSPRQCNIVKYIDTSTAHWDKEHNINLRKYSEIYGESHELNLVNANGELCGTYLTPLECFILEDGTAERVVMLALHKFKKLFDETGYIENPSVELAKFQSEASSVPSDVDGAVHLL